MKKVLRKCAYCEKSEINLETDDYLKYNSKYYHTDCFIEREQNKKKNRLSDEQINLLVVELKEKNKHELKLSLDKDHLIYWIYENYSVNVLTSTFFLKLKSINEGTFKGVNEGISNEDILNIFKKMKSYLDKNANNMKNKGRNFKGIQERISYDLSVVINNYDKYKAWKLEQESHTLREEEQDIYVENKKLYANKIRTNINKINEKNEVDIISLIDELF
jgi:hypothetical protein